MRIDPSQYSKVVVLTGAGISVASGLRTYRGPGGVWTDGGDPAVATIDGFRADPARTWALMGPLREASRRAAPNAAHRAIADFAERVVGSLTVVTQNVDGLHQRAGSAEVIEVHGNVHRTRCAEAECALAPYVDETIPSGAPSCPRCGGLLRPDVVFFGEPLPIDAEWAVKKALRDCDLFVAVGTSGTVSPASNYVRSAAYEGARTLYVNLESMTPPNPAFQETLLGPADEVLPALLGGA